jgi:rfaE bifunctional protein kinase chain/domain
VIPDLSKKYGHKIRNVDELLAKLGPFPRRRKVIMCHGVFDIVHPGHLRHLLFAKTKAPILVASVTADQHIEKGIYRPHVPHELRALNLAALEMVDYVLIDTNPMPLETIARLQPDFFAKGYEYVATGMPQKTEAEAKAVQSYGGEIIFTPGDIVYSSSRLIEASPPSLKIEKLLTLMTRNGLDFDGLRQAIDLFKGRRVHVIGDTIVDTLTRTTVIGSQAKTPTLSVRLDDRTDYVGGAAIVAQHLRSAGAEVTLSTVLGNDPLKDFVLGRLGDSGVRVRHVVDPTRPTTNKNAILADSYRLLKLDTVDNRPISDGIRKQLADSIAATPSEAIVFSDFRHGIFHRSSIQPLIDAVPEGVFKAADSQVASRWGNITEFRGFDLITPNEREGRFALGDQDSGVRSMASALYDAAACRTLILKLGDRGVLVYRSNDDSLDSFFSIDSFVDRVADPVGAGDALLAYATLASVATGSAIIAAILGSAAAACECAQEGNVPVAAEDVRAKLEQIEKEARYLA